VRISAFPLESGILRIGGLRLEGRFALGSRQKDKGRRPKDKGAREKDNSDIRDQMSEVRKVRRKEDQKI